MNSYKSSAQLKALAKDSLLGNYQTVIPAMLIPTSLTFLVALSLGFFMPIYSSSRMILSYLIELLAQIIIGVFNVGAAKLYLNILCKQPFHLFDMFYGFREETNKSLTILAFTTALHLLFFTPSIIILFLYINSQSLFLIPLLTIFSIAGILASCFLSLALSQCFYLLVDLPRYSAWEIMKISNKIMKGHKARLFYLQVSFLGMLLLGLFSCSIGMLWIAPYMNATYAHFYLDLMAHHQKTEG